MIPPEPNSPTLRSPTSDLSPPRPRLHLALVLLAVIAAGLASRKFAAHLPEFIAAHTGDALYTVAAYLGFALLFPRARPIHLGLAAFAASSSVELSQLIDTPWLNHLRTTLPGKLLLGQGFLAVDLVRYLAGATLATTIDLLVPRRAPHVSS